MNFSVAGFGVCSVWMNMDGFSVGHWWFNLESF